MISKGLLLSTILLITFSCAHLAGQSIKILPDAKYQYNNKVHQFEELKDILESNPEAMTIFNRARRARKTAKVLLITGSGVLAGALAIWISHDPDMYCDLFCLDGAIAQLGMIAGTGLLFSAIGPGYAYTVRKSKTIETFNAGLIEKGVSDKLNSIPEWQLSLGQTSNGVGIALVF